jgi:radical SAM superfamily enzyme with C-terminal helix-hairpin-helix motif
MASSSNNADVSPLVGVTVTEKLDKTNHAIWKAQILAVVRGARLIGHLTDATPAPAEETISKDSADKEIVISNPAYEEWYAKDQQALSFVLRSLGREVLSQVATHDTTAKLWSVIEAMYASQNRARAVNTRLALATANKGSQSIAEYVGKMRTLRDEMAVVGRPIEDEEILTYIFSGLDIEFNPVVSALLARTAISKFFLLPTNVFL